MATERRKMGIEIFISHSHKDRVIAEAMVNFLITGIGIDSNDIRCTSYAPTGLPIGAPIADALRRDIDDCRFFLPLVTPNASNSEYVAFEIGAAWALKTSIKPLVISSDDPKIPALLQGSTYCDLKNLESLIQLADELSKAIFVNIHLPTANQMLAAARAFQVAIAAY